MGTNRNGRSGLTPRRLADPGRALDLLGALWSSAASIPPLSIGAGTAYRTLFMTVRGLVVGRRITVRWDRGELTMIVTQFDSRLDMRTLTLGRLARLDFGAREITWGASKLGTATAVVGMMQVRPGPPPVLVATPVQVTLDVPGSALPGLLRQAGSRFSADIDAEGNPLVTLAGRESWGQLEVDVRLDDAALLVRLRAVRWHGRRWRLPGWLPPRRVDLPELPRGVVLTGVATQPHRLLLTGTVAEWQLPFSRRRLDVLLYQLRTSRLLSLTRAVR